MRLARLAALALLLATPLALADAAPQAASCTTTPDPRAHVALCEQHGTTPPATERHARWAVVYVQVPGVPGVSSTTGLQLDAYEGSERACADASDPRTCRHRNEARVESRSGTGVPEVDALWLRVQTERSGTLLRPHACSQNVRGTPGLLYQDTRCELAPEALP